MSLSVFTIAFVLNFLCPFCLTLCRLSPFLLSYVAFSRPCRLLDFTLTGPCFISVNAQVDTYLCFVVEYIALASNDIIGWLLKELS